jgi:hypothetical protein
MKKVVLLVISLILVSCEDTWDTPTEMTLRTMNMDGMIAWYPFNGNADDESPNFNHGTVYNAPLSHDRFENEDSAYYFGNSEFDWDHRIEADIDTELVDGELTIAWWIMREGTGYISPRPFEFWVPNDGNGKLVINIRNNEDNLLFEHIVGDTKVEYTFNHNFYQWDWFAYTVGNGEANFYANGELLQTIQLDTEQVKLGNDTAFGRMNHPSWDAFAGRLDDIVIYNRVLSKDELDYFYLLDGEDDSNEY